MFGFNVAEYAVNAIFGPSPARSDECGTFHVRSNV